MLVEVMAGVTGDLAVTLVGMLSGDMPRLATLGADTLVSVLAVYVATNLRGPRADKARYAARAYNWNGGRQWWAERGPLLGRP